MRDCMSVVKPLAKLSSKDIRQELSGTFDSELIESITRNVPVIRQLMDTARTITDEDTTTEDCLLVPGMSIAVATWASCVLSCQKYLQNKKTTTTAAMRRH